MAAELFTIDRSKLGRVVVADPMGFLGQLSTAAQACRAAFLAANVGAIVWDKERFPDLLLGVWSDSEQPQQDSGRRRRPKDASESAELSTWLQLRPAWPQLGGPSIGWPLEDKSDRTTYDHRVDDLTEAVVAALNTTYRRSMQMARTLVGSTEPMSHFDGLTRPEAAPALTGSESHAGLTGPAPTPMPDPESETLTVTALSDARTFTASGVAHSENEVAEVLATLARSAESASQRGSSNLAHLDHAVTPLPSGIDGLSSNGQRGRYLVTVTATIDARR
ncbi:hypothetical protein [Antrihabitans cavernicola]|uniref:Uncharacterized protein n=1 Tax=Antrihabitans cavernicola TaxID=2495913 RepID=A0A5A7SEG6_9NOCA|nr:hypothetical protein [Spelaeibacter cavernicola]KAA0023023.1 hypothetical protein FOY51_11050 [Spelaeibacter cavernicola]